MKVPWPRRSEGRPEPHPRPPLPPPPPDRDESLLADLRQVQHRLIHTNRKLCDVIEGLRADIRRASDE
jgi:hypothetical protein